MILDRMNIGRGGGYNIYTILYNKEMTIFFNLLNIFIFNIIILYNKLCVDLYL